MNKIIKIILVLSSIYIILRFYNKYIDTFDNKKNIYIITNISLGGSKKYLNDITNYYVDNNFIYIKSKNELNDITLINSDILFVQQIVNTDITPVDIIKKERNNCKMYICIHDLNWLSGKNTFDDSIFNIYLYPDQITNSPNYQSITELFSVATNVILPSKYIYNIYKLYFPSDNFIISDHIDYYVNKDSIYIPPIINNTINIGNLSDFHEVKGSEYILLLMDKYKTYKNYTINYSIVKYNIPSYNETEYYDYAKKYNLHGLLYLNKWGETWCYSLTKALNTGLPICYNNIGSFIERISNKKQHFKGFDKENDDINKIYIAYENMLDFIINNNGKYNSFYSNTNMVYPPLYNSIFS